jgi:hypothetical protein
MRIEIPEQGDERHRLWCDLMDLAQEFPGAWTIIGAHMVALHAWRAGLTSRPSDDVDVLVNVRIAVNGTEQVSAFLRDRGYEPEIAHGSRVHLFRREAAQIDVLAPDRLGERANTRTVRPFQTIRIPGGTQALARSSTVEVRSRDRDGELPLPSLLGAILIKARAINIDDLPAAQRSDLALLLHMVEEPDELAGELSRRERRWLLDHQYFGDPADLRWTSEGLDRERVALVYRRLVA